MWLSISLIFLSACSTFFTKSPTNTLSTAALVSQITSHCTDLDAPELGDGKMCIDNGFRIKADDFSFSNWGRSTEADANVTIQTLVDLFGHSAVCVDGPSTECVMRPTTVQKLEEWNNALAGGRRLRTGRDEGAPVLAIVIVGNWAGRDIDRVARA